MINKEADLKIDKICRCCMCENENMHNVFEDKKDSHNTSVLLLEKLMACASVEVTFGDGLPYNVCTTCEGKLNSAYEFRQQCKKSDSTLRELTSTDSKANITKQEDIVIEPDVHDDIFDDEDDLPLIQTNTKHKKTIPDPKKKQDDKYTCKFCYKTLHTEKGLKLHMKTHTGEKIRQCLFCNAKYARINFFIRHIGSHDKPGLIHSCKSCDKTFPVAKELFKHYEEKHEEKEIGDNINREEMKIKLEVNTSTENNSTASGGGTSDKSPQHKPESIMIEINDAAQEALLPEDEAEEVPDPKNLQGKGINNKNHTCHVCGSSFARPHHLAKHMVRHQTILVHKCDRCEKAFATEDHLKEHIDDEHLNKPYRCTMCNKTFNKGEYLIRHLRLHQTSSDKEISLNCSLCDVICTSSEDLATHTKIHLSQDKCHVCVECGKGFSRLYNLNAHQKTHSGVKDTSKLHLCIYCGKEFSNSSNMIVHMRRHTGQTPYKCKECGKGFPRSHDLKCHERIHSGEKPYLCTLCGKSFTKSNKLLRHSRVHTGERPYVCNICGNAFTQANDLSTHMRRHTGARPYICGVCPARFIQSGQLTNHRRKMSHWMEIASDLKGGHRVEPVNSPHEPVTKKFKSDVIKKETETTESRSANSEDKHKNITTQHTSDKDIELKSEESNSETSRCEDIKEPEVLSTVGDKSATCA